MLQPYVPHLVPEWLAESPEVEHREVEGTLVFADISGFTALTERLASSGKAGAEEMGDILNSTFEELLSRAYAYGAQLLKWGGDAVLLLFSGGPHAARACHAAQAMQQTISRIGRLKTSAGRVDLGISIGIHTGNVDLILARTPIRELIVTGPAASWVTSMEKVAERGEIVVSPETVYELAQGSVGGERGDGFLLSIPIDAPEAPPFAHYEAHNEVIAQAVDPQLREHLLGGEVAPEHRHVAVGFVQFKGVSQIMAEGDPGALVAELRTVLGRTQEVVAAQGISLLSTDVDADGGKLIVVSGAPRVSGDDEARVLSALREIMDVPTRLTLRGGVNHGRVFAGNYGTRERRVYSVAGDCVNLAARVMASADPGQLRALPDVLAASRTAAFEVTELPPFMAKGKSEPIVTLAVGRPIEAARPQASSTLFGRDREMTQLRDALEDARQGKGRLVEVMGERGMGKSRLIDELCDGADAEIIRVIGETYTSATPYAPFRRILRSALGLPYGADEATLTNAIEQAVDACAPHLRPWIPLIGIAGGLTLPETPEVAALDGKFRKPRLEESVCDFLGAALTRATLLCVEDIRLVDSASVDLLNALAVLVPEHPWMLVVATTASQGQGQASHFPEVMDAMTIYLGPLSDEAALELLMDRTRQRPIAPHRLEAVVRRAEGNPMYLREIIAAVAAGADVDELPASLEQLAAAHVDRLSPVDRRLLRSAAVLGFDVDVDLLRDVLDPDAPEPDFAPLAEFLSQTDANTYTFEHQILREAAYEGLPYSVRSRLHSRAAESIERRAGDRVNDSAGILSIHHLAAGQFRQAWEFSMQAAESARSSYALEEAGTAYRRAITASSHVSQLGAPSKAQAWESLGDVNYMLGEFENAADAFASARRLFGSDPLKRAGLLLRTARVLERKGDLSHALATLSHGIRALEGDTSREAQQMRSRLLARYGWARYMQGRPKDAVRWVEEAEEVATECNETRTRAFALRVLDAVDLATGNLEGPARSEPALTWLSDLGDRVELAHTYVGLGGRAYFQGNWTAAADNYRKALESFLAAGDRWNAATQQANLAELLIDQGDDGGAHSLLSDAMPVWQATGQVGEIAFGDTLLARLDARDGNLDSALEHLEKAREGFVSAGEPGSARYAEALVAEAHQLCGDPRIALSQADMVLASVPDTDPWVPLLHRVRGLALADLGRTDEAIHDLHLSVEKARERAADHDVGFGIDALLALGASDDDGSLLTERDRIFTSLGITVSVHG